MKKISQKEKIKFLVSLYHANLCVRKLDDLKYWRVLAAIIMDSVCLSGLAEVKKKAWKLFNKKSGD